MTLDENAALLYPDQYILRIVDVLRKVRDGNLRYVDNHTVFYISEARIIEADNCVTMYDMGAVYSDLGNNIPFVTTYLRTSRI